MPDTLERENFSSERIAAPHVVRGVVQIASEVEHNTRIGGAKVVTPKIILDDLVWPRSEPGPAFETPMREIIDFLVEAGKRMDVDANPFFAEALDRLAVCSPLGRRVMENCYREIPYFFRREGIELEVERALGGMEYLDGWKDAPTVDGSPSRIRAYPPRLVHVLSGNAPAVAPLTIVRGAITKGVHLMKLPSNDFFTATAVLRTLADVDANHPVTRSFSAVYWRGGDERVESALFRSQYFDKIVVWGGEAAVRHASKYVAPGFEMVSFDPKVSISLLGREIFHNDETLAQAVDLAAKDVCDYDQDACSSSRFQFIEGAPEQVEEYCRKLAAALGRETAFGNAVGRPLPDEIREEVNSLRALEPIYGVYGRFDGGGLVIRSDEPLSFTPSGKTVNVVHVEDLSVAVRFVTIATQTVGVWPVARRKALRNSLASAGAQRITTLGTASFGGGFGGAPHDGGWPVNRFMRWVLDSGPEN